jgi:FKBP-type peptidyl-prolyl cis-trans isomerase SlyD
MPRTRVRSCSCSDRNGERLAATVTLIEGDDVTLDFNHPLAGKDLTFEIELVEVVEVAADE